MRRLTYPQAAQLPARPSKATRLRTVAARTRQFIEKQERAPVPVTRVEELLDLLDWAADELDQAAGAVPVRQAEKEE